MLIMKKKIYVHKRVWRILIDGRISIVSINLPKLQVATTRANNEILHLIVNGRFHLSPCVQIAPSLNASYGVKIPVVLISAGDHKDIRVSY